MTTAAIKRRAAHRAALKDIERLMDAKLNASVGRRLQVLARAVDAYESRHDPIEPPNRAAALQCLAESRRTPRPTRKTTGKQRR
jgi:HTH-type transcriptional regulator/antitoxin HigA